MTVTKQRIETSLSDLVLPEQYCQRPEVADKLQTLNAWRWFYRRNRARLVAAGAVVMVANRVYLRPSVVDQVLIEVGIEAARGEDVADAA